jgi:hypothetical protein
MPKKSKIKIYYAHPRSVYNTPVEERDIKLLEQLGYEVVNPNNPKTAKEYLKKRDFEVFFKMIDECTVMAYRSLPDGRITAGVALEVEYAGDIKMPCFELHQQLKSRRMTADETREYLDDVGVDIE